MSKPTENDEAECRYIGQIGQGDHKDGTDIMNGQWPKIRMRSAGAKPLASPYSHQSESAAGGRTHGANTSSEADPERA
jgi:hypothetical protein